MITFCYRWRRLPPRLVFGDKSTASCATLAPNQHAPEGTLMIRRLLVAGLVLLAAGGPRPNSRRRHSSADRKTPAADRYPRAAPGGSRKQNGHCARHPHPRFAGAAATRSASARHRSRHGPNRTGRRPHVSGRSRSAASRTSISPPPRLRAPSTGFSAQSLLQQRSGFQEGQFILHMSSALSAESCSLRRTQLHGPPRCRHRNPGRDRFQCRGGAASSSATMPTIASSSPSAGTTRRSIIGIPRSIMASGCRPPSAARK